MRSTGADWLPAKSSRVQEKGSLTTKQVMLTVETVTLHKTVNSVKMQTPPKTSSVLLHKSVMRSGSHLTTITSICS